MNITETLIFGIDSNIFSTIAEIGVALATGILAYYTYQSVKTSNNTLISLKKQVDIANKDFENKQIELEKPQIIDQLQQVINPLLIKIEGELKQINESLFLWNSNAHEKNAKFFESIPSEEFYNEIDITTQIGVIINGVSESFPNIRELCEKRYKIYLSLVELFTKIYQEINQPDCEIKICKLIFRGNPPYEVHSDSGYCDVMVTLWDSNTEDPTHIKIPSNDFYQAIINILIAKMLVQKVISHNDRDALIISKFAAKEAEIKNLLNSDSFAGYSKSFNSLIKELNSTDTQLKNEIIKIKMEYREKYRLNDEEYWMKS